MKIKYKSITPLIENTFRFLPFASATELIIYLHTLLKFNTEEIENIDEFIKENKLINSINFFKKNPYIFSINFKTFFLYKKCFDDEIMKYQLSSLIDKNKFTFVKEIAKNENLTVQAIYKRAKQAGQKIKKGKII